MAPRSERRIIVRDLDGDSWALTHGPSRDRLTIRATRERDGDVRIVPLGPRAAWHPGWTRFAFRQRAGILLVERVNVFRLWYRDE